jgi:DNA-directed RNA polymerase specialized sigma24 family protein
VESLTDTPASPPFRASAAAQPPALFHAHVTVLVRLAVLMLGDQAAAQDVVREALFGLRRRWDVPGGQDRAVADARASVLDGCRDALRRRPPHLLPGVPLSAEHRAVLTALHRLPGRQREAVVLRHCLGLPEDEAAEAMGVSRETVRSATHCGLAALAGLRQETRPRQ